MQNAFERGHHHHHQIQAHDIIFKRLRFHDFYSLAYEKVQNKLQFMNESNILQ